MDMIQSMILLLCGLVSTTAASWLSEYHQQGFVTPLGSMPAKITGKLQSLVEKLEADGEVLSEQNNVTLNPHLAHAEIMEAASSSSILDAVQQIVGPDITLLHTAIFAKYPKSSTGVNKPTCLSIIGAHQDRQYWGLEPESAPVTSVWIAIDTVTAENGAMQMYPGTHKSLLPHVKHADDCSALFDSQSISSSDLPSEHLSKTLELSPGQYAIFDSRVVHRSGRNTSPHRRVGITMIYARSDITLKKMDYDREIDDWRKPLPIRCAGGTCPGSSRESEL
mmetsp:Transcript_63044/g.117969  ORF Transcript_63044/g.117969 Transcript_63044/m.117969 type:complete len:279 (+) Transcript_63044:50-886(+)